MTTSGEIIRKILLDESIHGVFTGLDAQSLRNELSESEKQKADQEMYKLLNELYDNEVSYTHLLYDDIGLAEDVLNYVRYNGNKALSNLGFEPYFEEREFNPIIENALDTSTKNHDFFSVKGDGYTLALNVELYVMKTLFLIINIVLLKRFLLKLVGISFFMKVGIIKYFDVLLLLDKTFIKFPKNMKKLLKKENRVYNIDVNDNHYHYHYFRILTLYIFNI